MKLICTSLKLQFVSYCLVLYGCKPIIHVHNCLSFTGLKNSPLYCSFRDLFPVVNNNKKTCTEKMSESETFRVEYF